MQTILYPRIRLTKTDKKRLILPIDAITGIEEAREGNCVKVNTLDGFWYEVMNPIIEIDKKIDEAIARSCETGGTQNADRDNEAPSTKTSKIKRRKMLSAGVEKPGGMSEATLAPEPPAASSDGQQTDCSPDSNEEAADVFAQD